MTTLTLTSTYNYDNRAQRWRDSASGQWVSYDNVVSEMRVHQEATYATLESLTRQLYSGQISLAQWQIAAASELKDAHLAQAMFGVGGRANMGQEEWGRVGQTLREQYAYLSKFAEDIAAGKVSEKMALARIDHYGDSTQASYWNEYIDKSDGLLDWDNVPDDNECDVCPQIAAGSPYTRETIPCSPGDGYTPCRGRCRCRVRRRGQG